jgi:cytochrome c oxidase assembly protein subunit 19
MMNYLSCIKKVKGTNEEECRNIAKSYLSCRMDRYVRLALQRISIFIACRNLMAKDEFKNLGFGEEKSATAAKKEDAAEGKKGELRW